MRVVARTISLVLIGLPIAAGCASNPYALQSQNQALQQQQTTLAQRNQELQNRAATLDRDNQELETLLAQTRQQAKVLDDHLAALRDQLSTATAQLAQLRDEKQLSEKQTEALMASTRRRSGAQITANNSLERSLPPLNLSGIDVRADGDVVRFELPAARLFQPGYNTLQPVAGPLLETVAAEIARAYPDHKVGIEGHADGDVRSPQAGDAQQISVARATAVYQYLTARGQIPANRMFIAGHGNNHPVVSNATAAGKARNNRVELVIYPEKVTAAR